ncbi:MAG: HAMP domain-containing sensor histidine kinase [Clostridia bacterium]
MPKLPLHRFKRKLIGYFVKVLLVSILLSSTVTAFMCVGFIDSELMINQQALRKMATDLVVRTAITPAEAIEVLSPADYRIHEVPWDHLTQAQGEAIARGESVSTGFFMGKTLYFALGKTAIAVEAYPASRVLLSAILRSLGGNLILIALGLLLVYLISRRLALPLVNLTRATRQVAKGNFDVSLNLQQARFAGGIEEIAELTENFNRMARELKNVEYLRRDFTGNLSHELKTPVSSISGYARLLQCDDLPSDERREFARAISEESARLSSLSDNLLKLTRLESQPPDAVRTPFSLDEQLRRLINACHPQIERKKQTIDVSLGRVTLSAYEELLSQVWRNLLENAIKFTPEGGKLFVSLTRARACAIVAISDTGPGMDKATTERIFEKFYQADASHHTGGSGLGLPLVKRIVDICSGTIEVESEPGKGSRFTVTLPEK